MRLAIIALLAVLGITGCGGDTPSTAPDLARGGPPGGPAGSGPTVTGAEPNAAPRGTTLDVRVLGSGFDNGSRAIWALDGDTTFAKTRVKTNATAFVSSTELRANITIGLDATIDLYDIVVVTTGGKKGIGLEQFAVTLEIIDLGAGDPSRANDVNDNGQVVGYPSFIWQNGVFARLNPPGFQGGEALGINDKGQVVLYGYDANQQLHSWRWEAGLYTELLPPPGYCCSWASGISEAGDVTGGVRTPSGVGHAALWPAGSNVAIDIHGSLPGSSYGWEVNSSRVVVGSMHRGDGRQNSFQWTSTGGFRILDEGVYASEAIAVNEAGQVVGTSTFETTTGWIHSAWIWQPGGTRQSLGTLGGPNSWAIDITEDGRVTGRSDVLLSSNGKRRISNGSWPYIWTPGAGMKALEVVRTAGMASGYGINASGWVAGRMTTTTGGERATLWRPKQ